MCPILAEVMIGVSLFIDYLLCIREICHKNICGINRSHQGMRIVQSAKEFVDSFLGAKREAAASVGIDTMLLEENITRPRHIEVQVLFSW